MRFLSLFAGVGGFDLALERAGFESAGQVELDPFCQRVLAARWPGVARWTDVRGVGVRLATGEPGREAQLGGGTDADGWLTGDLDLLCAGFPCQDFSVAGKRAGLDGYRGTLFWEIVRLAKELRPTWGLFENVPGLISSRRGRDFWAVLEGLRECWPAVGWRVLDSQHFGVPQRRRRVFLVGGPSVEAVEAVLFEREGGGRDSPAGGEAGARTASTLGSGSTGTRFNHDGDYVTPFDTTQITSPLNYSAPKPGDPCHPLAAGMHPPTIAHALRASHDGSENGTGRGTPLVVGQGQGDPNVQADQAYSVDGHASCNAVMFVNPRRHDVRGVHRGDVREKPSLNATNNDLLFTGLVRRLTPLECERLQAFPDGWSCLDVPLEDYAADPESASERCRCPDSPRYRAMGNAVTVTVVEWLAHRLRAAMANP